MKFLQLPIRLYKDAYTGLTPAIWWLSLVLLINRAGTMVIPFMTVYLTQQLHFPIAQAGIVMACFGSGAIAGALLGGWLSDKIGFYQVQFWSLFLNGLFFFLLGQLQTFPQFCAVAFIQGTVADAFRPANSIAITAYSTGQNRTRSYALNRLAVNLGWSVGPALGGMLASISYHFLFWVDGFTCITAAILMRMLLPPVPAPPKAKHNEAARKTDGVIKDRLFLWFILFATITAICLFQFSNMIPLYFKQELKMKEWLIGLNMSLNGILIVFVEMVLVHRLNGKKPDLLYVVFGILLIAVAYLLINLSMWYHIFSVLFIMVLTFGEIFCLPFMNNFWFSRSKEHNRGQYAALYTISYSFANIATPTAGTFIVQQLGFSAWWLITIGLCLLAAGGTYWVHKKAAGAAFFTKIVN
ncbi:Predicted arabinose efflux permease, MFS family [Chitinophaga terrae (ex Kim and Jung 2007)]|uniref:Predicted arabinose efflux permease, MFS family n=1 Tax=Chitinophaga terrae (ex Kim and Jung 2007) TaxID=408074 RepID=A0A1H3Z704_9BACT|nr:MFS transporter [Chitinophaga terrae (ex Kim and Jung 2007)]MDQ0107334.1 putative MFS family arabinose efflux permease [Chitinophaga terrae (ex Kim and Jung 2007)]GEP88604.1 MFS transporter [Chitinophaga terrae (ex Kim and Jung 2007)]SEA19427.1 Predicted arabinose efflux permease, MFS family [Chitinophaga terrae (ex Kim and Jung 2007)]